MKNKVFFPAMAILLMVTSSLSLAASPNSCTKVFQAVFSEKETLQLKIFTPKDIQESVRSNKSIQGFFKTKRGQLLHFKFESGDVQKPMEVLIHGLGDNLNDLSGIDQFHNTKLGYRTLSVDTHLSGLSLTKYLELNKDKIPQNFSYKNNTHDISNLIQATGVRDVYLVGHSYGGGLVWDIKAYFDKLQDRDQRNFVQKGKNSENTISVRGVVMMAPYLARVDKYEQEKWIDLTVIPGTIEQIEVFYRDRLGWPKELYQDLISSWFKVAFDQIEENRKRIDQFDTHFKTQKFKDTLMDPFMDIFLTKAYSKYFLDKMRTEKGTENLSTNDIGLVDSKVKAAISLTKGIREFDVLSRDKTIYFRNKTPVLVIGGQKDGLVKPLQIKDFTQRLEDLKYPVESVFIEGGTHLFPQTHSDQVAETIHIFFEKQNNNQK
jgi:pimeloyl-ACP methyl ester carboxylesterase